MAAAQVCFRAKGSDACPIHPGNKVCFECEDCPGTLVCLVCITSNHKGHRFRDLKAAVEEKVEKISFFIQKSKQETLPGLLQQMKNTSKTLEQNNHLFQDKIARVGEHGEILKAEIDFNTAKTVSTLELEWRRNTEMLDTHQKIIEKLEKQLQKEIKDLQQTLKTEKEAMVYDTGSEVGKAIKVPTMPTMTTSTFSPGKDFKFHIERAFGDIQGDGLYKASTAVKLLDKPQTLFEQKTSYAIWYNCICPTVNNRAWTSSFSENKIHLVDEKGVEHKTLGLDVCIYKICIHPTTGVLYCSSDIDRTISSVNTETGVTTAMFKTSDSPNAIACMDNDRMVVSICGGVGGEAVCMYTMKGKLLHSHQHKGSYAPDLAVCPQTNNTAVLASTDGVLVLNDLFQEVYTYKGEGLHQKTPNKYRTIDCRTAVFTDQYLLVGDFNNKMIHLLSAATGLCKKIINTDSMSCVAALGVQQSGVLWVGCRVPNKILCIKYSE